MTVKEAYYLHFDDINDGSDVQKQVHIMILKLILYLMKGIALILTFIASMSLGSAAVLGVAYSFNGGFFLNYWVIFACILLGGIIFRYVTKR